jgi:uncharacterized membrane protein
MSVLRELLALFVDDGSLALGILVLIALAAVALPALEWSPVTDAIVFYGACLAVLVENVLRRARR